MKAYELIRKLQTHDPDLEVMIRVPVIGCDDTILLPADTVEIRNDSETPNPRIQIWTEDLLLETKLSFAKE
jgi:hypothetical protein